MQRFGVIWSARLKLLTAFTVLPLGIARGESALKVEFEYVAEPGCGSGQQFWRALRRRMPAARFAVPGTGDMVLSVRLTRTGREVRGDLGLRTPEGPGETNRRVVAGTSCREVVEALALTAALAIEEIEGEAEGAEGAEDEGLQSGEGGAYPSPANDRGGTRDRAGPARAASKSQKEQEPDRPKEAHREDADEKLVRETDGVPPASRAALGVYSFVGQIVAPTVTCGLAIDAVLAVPLSAEWVPTFGVAVLYAPSALLQPASDVAVRWAAVEAEACPTDWRLSERFDVAPCATGSVGSMAVTGVESTAPRTVRRFWVGIGGQVRGDYLVSSSVSLTLVTSAQVPVLAREFEITQPRETVAATPRLAWRAALGAFYHF